MNKMSINLLNYINKRVTVTTRDGKVREGRIEWSSSRSKKTYTSTLYPISFVFSGITNFYTKDGLYWYNDNSKSPLDIMKIELLDEVKTVEKDVMSKLIADAIISDVLQYIQSDNWFADVVVKLIEKYLSEKLGQLNPELKNEIITQILDNMKLIPSK